ncbi:hypothetical protein SO802_028206 [Lithocarpus litseifolius]|uniref:DUF8040 domain-containing protein n=1 Tax=Lithocarpus litseifolius TaxID=425828 RepID=A0AAW2BRW2_9ROSI
MDKNILRHLGNELKRLHLLEEDTGIVSVEEAVGTLLFIVEHNADFRLTANPFQHSLETIQRRFWGALWAIHALGCLIIRPDADAAELPHSLRGNEKYYPWFEKLAPMVDPICPNIGIPQWIFLAGLLKLGKGDCRRLTYRYTWRSHLFNAFARDCLLQLPTRAAFG